MKKNLLVLFIFCSGFARAQIICIYCYNLNDSLSQNVNNLLLNGGFEDGCTNGGSICPNSTSYSCDITNWLCTGGGPDTYASVVDTNTFFLWMFVEGLHGVYFGNYRAYSCSSAGGDISCLGNTGCSPISGIPSGYPYSEPTYGGVDGVSLEQTVNGLMAGNIYVLEFWAGGENIPGAGPGLFAVDVGFGKTFLRDKVPATFTGIGTRYIIEFTATSSTHTIRFTNWGHIGNCTELVLDDVRLYTLAELSSLVPPCGTLVYAAFTAPNFICPGTCTNFTNLSQASTYQWYFPGGVPSTSTYLNPQNICYANPGSYDVQLIASNANGSDTLLLQNYITVYPTPPPQNITQNGDTLFAIAGAGTYQWYFNGNIINGATNYFYVAPQSGDYNVVCTDGNGCEVEAAVFNVVASSLSSAGSPQSAVVYPDPVKEKLEIRNLKLGTAIEISIYNIIGEKVPSAVDCGLKTVDCGLLPSGMYWLEIISGEKTFRTKFVKQ